MSRSASFPVPTAAMDRPGPYMRAVLATPFLGRMARDIAREPDSLWYALVILLTVLVLGVKTWGVMVLTVMALAAVPVIFVLLILITLG